MAPLVLSITIFYIVFCFLKCINICHPLHGEIKHGVIWDIPLTDDKLKWNKHVLLLNDILMLTAWRLLVDMWPAMLCSAVHALIIQYTFFWPSHRQHHGHFGTNWTLVRACIITVCLLYTVWVEEWKWLVHLNYRNKWFLTDKTRYILTTHLLACSFTK